MGRRTARGLHTALSALGAILYFLFVIPRWWVLTGDITPTLGIVGRIATGLPIAAAAVPVMLTLRQSLSPEFKTPELALRLRAWSAVLHVVAGALLIVTAVVEIWLSLEAAGPWLFAVYGAAGSIAILAIAAFLLSFVAEQPPGPPKPPKVKKEKAIRRTRKRKAKANESEGEQETTPGTGEETDDQVVDKSSADSSADSAVTDAEVTDVEAAEVVVGDEATEVKVDAETTEVTVADEATEVTVADEPEHNETTSTGSLLNRRPTDKKRRRLRR